MIFKKYSKFLKEHALFDGDYDRYDDYFSEVLDSKKTLKNVDIEINILLDLFKNINFTDIKFDNNKYKDNENYGLKFSREINTLISPLTEFLDEILDKNEIAYNTITELYFGGQGTNLSFDVQIERDNFNKFHFPVDLPPFLKNIGLGKKIIRSAIEKFDYLLFTKEEDSFNLKMAVHSITKMEDVFSFMKDQNILIMKDDLKIIEDKLKEWFESSNYENHAVDRNFLEKYRNDILNDPFLANIYKEKL